MIYDGLGGKSAPLPGTQPRPAQDGANEAIAHPGLGKGTCWLNAAGRQCRAAGARGGPLRAEQSEGTHLCERFNPQANGFGDLPSCNNNNNNNHHSFPFIAIRTKSKLHESTSFCPFPYCTRGSERMALAYQSHWISLINHPFTYNSTDCKNPRGYCTIRKINNNVL